MAKHPSKPWQHLPGSVSIADNVGVEHSSDELLERYSMGHLSEPEMAPLEEHLLICEACRNRLVLMDFDIAALREALRRKETDEQ